MRHLFGDFQKQIRNNRDRSRGADMRYSDAMNARIRGLLLIYCVGCYVAFGLFFALTPLWWHDMWNQLGGRVVIIYGLMAPVSIPMLAVAPVALPPGPGIHAVIFWVVCV